MSHRVFFFSIPYSTLIQKSPWCFMLFTENFHQRLFDNLKIVVEHVKIIVRTSRQTLFRELKICLHDEFKQFTFSALWVSRAGVGNCRKSIKKSSENLHVKNLIKILIASPQSYQDRENVWMTANYRRIIVFFNRGWSSMNLHVYEMRMQVVNRLIYCHLSNFPRCINFAWDREKALARNQKCFYWPTHTHNFFCLMIIFIEHFEVTLNLKINNLRFLWLRYRHASNIKYFWGNFYWISTAANGKPVCDLNLWVLARGRNKTIIAQVQKIAKNFLRF